MNCANIAARGSAAARLREKDLAGARQVLAEALGDLGTARAAIDRYAGRRDKKPWVGGVLGLVPGLGYIYSGEYANAARSIILNSLFIWGMVETGSDDDWAVFSVLTFVEFTWYSGSIYGGIDSAHRHNQRRLDGAVNEVRGEKTPPPRPGSGAALLAEIRLLIPRPRCGDLRFMFRKKFSTLWKLFFHGVEKTRPFFPWCGNFISTEWKTRPLQASAGGLAVRSEGRRPHRHPFPAGAGCGLRWADACRRRRRSRRRRGD